ncbi:MAG: energy transducer TonB [Hymenobacteraceae bacterium]|nr:energy transducer TonB [Hymenobacteraceae bacterium]
MRHPLLVAVLIGGILAAAPLQAAFAQKAKKAAPAPEVPSLTKTYPEDLTDPLPTFAGGAEALRKFLLAHVIVPPFALTNQLAGAVDIEFVLHPDGRMDSIQVSNGACCGLDEEALRVARLTVGKWTAGKIDGTPVKTRVDLPITFRVANKNSRSIAYLAEMKAKYVSYQGSPEQAKDQQTYQEQVGKQPAPAQ